MSVPADLLRRWQTCEEKLRAGEIKPHNARAIKHGVEQLFSPPGAKIKLLATYQQAGKTNAAIIRIGEVKRRNEGMNSIPWHVVATVPFDYSKRIPISACPTKVGNEMEDTVRRLLFSQDMPVRAKRGPQSGGHDFESFEMEVEFLRELVAELAGEING